MKINDDLRFSLRNLRNRSLQAAAVVAMLAVGIGATTVVYTVLHQLVLDPFPYPGGDRMVYLWKTHATMGFSVTPGLEEIQAWEEAASVEQVEIYKIDRKVVLREDGPSEHTVALIRPTMFSFLNRYPVAGRALVQADMQPGSPPVALISHSLWQSRYGGGNAIGSWLELEEGRYEIVGVMPAGFHFPRYGIDLWLPLILDAENLPRGLNNLARLSTGFHLEQVKGELQSILTGLSQGSEGPEWETVIYQPADMLGSTTESALWILMAAVVLVLFVACANVASLLLVQNANRSKQLALRSVLGASRWRLTRHLLAESLLLALGGGLFGLLFAYWSLDVIRALRPDRLDELATVALNSKILIFAVSASLTTSLLFGLLPALRSSRPDLVNDLRDSATRTISGRNPVLRRVFVIAQIAVCTILIVGAGLLGKTFRTLQSIDPGFNPERLVTTHLELPPQRYPSKPDQFQFFRNVEERLAGLPGVQHVTYGMGIPPRGGVTGGILEIDGRTDTPQTSITFSVNSVMDDYFRVMEIPVVAGRSFLPEEIRNEAPVIIINQTMADRYWPGSDPVGSRVRLSEKSDWETVVGVVGDVRTFGLRHQSAPHIYYPFGVFTPDSGSMIVKLEDTSVNFASMIREAIWQVDPRLPVPEVELSKTLLLRSIEEERFNTALFTTFSVVALTMALLGLYGVVSYWVADRRREFGIRLALGARRQTILGMVLRSGALVAALGIAIGLVVSFWLTALLESQLVDVAPRDPAILSLAAAILLASTLLASFVPAWRATRVDPLDALRAE